MDPVLAQIYQDILPNMPYLLAAYGLLWLGLMGYVAVTLSRLGKIEKQLTLLEDVVAKRG